MLNLESLVCDLPEDVLKLRWSGDFERELKLIDHLLGKEIPNVLRDRLLVERRMVELLPKYYRIPRKLALLMLKEKIPDFRDEELDALEMDRAVEYIFIKGERYYLHSFLKTLLKVNPNLAARAGIVDDGSRPLLDDTIAHLKEHGHLSYRFRIRGELQIDDKAFVPNAHVRVHMPVPQLCAQQSQIEIHSESDHTDDLCALQRTVYFERDMTENTPFCVDYSYTGTIRYVDLLNGTPPKAPIYTDVPAPAIDDMDEQEPHIIFSPMLRSLARELIGEESDPIRIAWNFYDYITTHIRYSFMRPYFLIERQSDYCALNGKGDCGIQALLFITLCRIAGIPARWQSGLDVDPKHAGSHDWAQFYVEPYGWLFCDPSYGGGAYRVGNEERRKFYFGNLDPFRMVANSRYQTDFNPPKQCDRVDPYDNQDGEVELNGIGLLGSQFNTTYTTLQFEKID